MSSIIHGLIGRTEHSEHKSNGSNIHTVIHDDMKVESVVRSQTHSKPFGSHSSHKINSLMAKLGSTYSQVDEYSRHRTEEISEAVKESIDKVVYAIQEQQQQLLDDAEKESYKIEDEYKDKLTSFLNELDRDKAVKLAELEKSLNVRQEEILQLARQRIDSINEEGNRLRATVFKEAQAITNSKVDEITAKVVELEGEDANHRLASKTKTIIETHARPEIHRIKHN